MEKFLAILAKQKRFLIGAALVLLVILGLTTNAALNKGEFTWPENTLEFIRLPDYKVAKITVTEAENRDFYKFDIAFDNQNASASADVQWSLEINGKAFQSGYGSFHGNPKALIHGAPKKEVCSGDRNFGSVKFILDPGNKIKEKNEDNNKFEVGISCGTGTVAMPAKAPLTAAPVKPENQTATVVVNQAPEKPIITYPAKGQKDVSLTPKFEWSIPKDDFLNQEKLNYRWFVREVLSEKDGYSSIIWDRDWHTKDTLDAKCKDLEEYPNAWTCNFVDVPTGILQNGKTYAFTVEAGDGQYGSGYAQESVFKTVQAVNPATVKLTRVVPKDNAFFGEYDAIKLQWNSDDTGIKSVVNFQWKVVDEKGRSAYEVTWHERAKFPGGTGTTICTNRNPNDWTCSWTVIPGGTLTPGEYSWFVEAGDGVKGFGYTKMGTFTVGKYFGGAPIEN